MADGADCVFSGIEACMCNPPHVKKIHAFIRAAKEVQRLREQGVARAEIGRRVSDAGRARFWARWPDAKNTAA